MSTPYVLNDIIKHTVVCYQTPQEALNVFYSRVDAVTGAPTQENMASTIDAAFATVYKPLLTNAASYRGSLFARVSPTTSPGIDTASSTGSGTGGTAPLPFSVCGVISRYGTAVGRAGRGRIFAPFPDASQQATAAPAGYSPLPTYVSTLLGNLAALMQGPQTYVNGGAIVTLTPVLFGSPTYAPPISASVLVVGQTYKIAVVGTTLWTTIGAASNTVGTVFTATAAGAGTGTARRFVTSGSVQVVQRAFGQQKWGTQHRRGSYGKTNNLPF